MFEHESDIIKECQQGQTDRFGELYDAYVRRIYNFIYYKTRHKETAEDLTSTTFFKALTHIGQCDPHKKFSSWLYKIAHNTVIDHYRSIKPEVNIDDVWDLTDDSDVVRDLDATLRLGEVEKYLKTLPSEKRNIIFMRVWQEMSYREIADAVGKSEASCKMAFSRAIADLRSTLPFSLILFSIIQNL